MGSSTFTAEFDEHESEYDQYRVLSMLAVSSIVLGIISITSLLFVRLAFIPVIGGICGWLAIRSIRQRPRELTGSGIAKIGVTLCSVLFVSSVAWAIYDYMTEVPDGYTRVTFNQLQPDPDVPELPVSPLSTTLDGEKVFVKGYMYPDDSSGPQRTFVLVPDMGTCCFGGQPALTDMIQIRLQDPLYITYSRQRRKLGGVLKVAKKKKPVSGLDGVYYQLDADYLK